MKLNKKDKPYLEKRLEKKENLLRIEKLVKEEKKEKIEFRIKVIEIIVITIIPISIFIFSFYINKTINDENLKRTLNSHFIKIRAEKMTNIWKEFSEFKVLLCTETCNDIEESKKIIDIISKIIKSEELDKIDSNLYNKLKEELNRLESFNSSFKKKADEKLKNINQKIKDNQYHLYESDQIISVKYIEMLGSNIVNYYEIVNMRIEIIKEISKAIEVSNEILKKEIKLLDRYNNLMTQEIKLLSNTNISEKKRESFLKKLENEKKQNEKKQNKLKYLNKKDDFFKSMKEKIEKYNKMENAFSDLWKNNNSKIFKIEDMHKFLLENLQ